MVKDVELSSFDLRYESYRMKNHDLEMKMNLTIMNRGIEEPLEGVDTKDGHILLDGFKRYRCAKKQNIPTAPYISLGQVEVLAVMGLLRTSNRVLSIVEQARFIDDLKNLHHMTVAEIAHELSRSKGWVSMRLGLIEKMSPKVREKIFSGDFPAYSFMYTLRKFMRMNGVDSTQVEELVLALSGKNLTLRQIEQIARSYFKGTDSFREHVRSGNLALTLKSIDGVPGDTGCSHPERELLKDLELTQKCFQLIMTKSRDRRLKSSGFHAQANLLTAELLRMSPAFLDAVRILNDTTGQA